MTGTRNILRVSILLLSFMLLAVPAMAIENVPEYVLGVNISADDTVYVGEEGLNLTFANESIELYFDNDTNASITDPSNFYVDPNVFTKTGLWTVRGSEDIKINVVQPELAVSLHACGENSNKTDITANGQIFVGDVIAVRIDSNLAELFNRTNNGLNPGDAEKEAGIFVYNNIYGGDENAYLCNNGTDMTNTSCIWIYSYNQYINTSGSSEYGLDNMSIFSAGISEISNAARKIAAECPINGINKNNGEAGKGRSEVSFVIKNDSVSISGENTVVRSNAYNVTISGRPNQEYAVWFDGTSSMTDSEVPVFESDSNVKYVRQCWLNNADFSQYEKLNQSLVDITNLGGTNAGLYLQNRHFVMAKTGADGNAVINVFTDSDTTVGDYTIRVQKFNGVINATTDPVEYGYSASPENCAGQADNTIYDTHTVTINPGTITITSVKSEYCLGENITFTGSDTDSLNVYLVITGGDLPVDGGVLSSPYSEINYTAESSNFTCVNVSSERSWEYKWSTEILGLDSGTYRVYAISSKKNASDADLSNSVNASFEVILNKPYINANVSSEIIGIHDKLTVSGTTIGNPSEAAVWIIGDGCWNGVENGEMVTVGVIENFISYETGPFAAGNYSVIIQHPCNDDLFDVHTYTGGDGIYIANSTDTTGSSVLFYSSEDGFVFNRTTALNDLKNLLDASKDNYTELEFIVDGSEIILNALNDTYTSGETINISGTTNINSGTLIVNVTNVSALGSGLLTPKNHISKVIDRDESDPAEWMIEFSLSGMDGGSYAVNVASPGKPAENSTSFVYSPVYNTVKYYEKWYVHNGHSGPNHPDIDQYSDILLLPGYRLELREVLAPQQFERNVPSELNRSYAVREGYHLKGWFDNPDFPDYRNPEDVITYTDGQNISISEDKKLVAVVDNNVTTLRFHKSDGTELISVDVVYKESYGWTGPLPWMWYSFDIDKNTCYYTETNGNGVKLFETGGYMTANRQGYVNNWVWINKSPNGTVIDLYPEDASDYCIITFDGNGSESHEITQSIALGKTENLSVNTYEMPGFTFAGWHNETGYFYEDEAPYTAYQLADRLKAIWNPHHYTVVFDGNGNDGGMMENMSFTGNESKRLTPNNFTKEGFEFVRWTEYANGTGKSYNDNALVSAPGDNDGDVVTLYADWSGRRVVVYLNTSGGQAVSDALIAAYNSTFGEAEPSLDDTGINRTGYTFVNWMYNGTVIYNTTRITASEDITIDAVWEPNTYYVNFSANGGTGSIPVQTFRYDEAQPLSLNAGNITRQGYEFAGWSRQGSAQTFTDGQSVMNLTAEPNATVQLRAIWKIKPTVQEQITVLENGTASLSTNKSGGEAEAGKKTDYVINATDNSTVVSMVVSGERNNAAAGSVIFNVSLKDASVSDNVVSGTFEKAVVNYNNITLESSGTASQSARLDMELDLKAIDTNLPEISSTIDEKKADDLKDFVEKSLEGQSKILDSFNIAASFTATGDNLAAFNNNISEAKIVMYVPLALMDENTTVHIAHIGDNGSIQELGSEDVTREKAGEFWKITIISKLGFSSYAAYTYDDSPGPHPPEPSRNDTGGSSSGTSAATAVPTVGQYNLYPRAVSNGGLVSFGASPVVKSILMPEGVFGTVILDVTSTDAPDGKRVFCSIGLTAPEFEGEAILEFVIPLERIKDAGFTVDDIALYHHGDQWELLDTRHVGNSGGYAVYNGIVTSCSPFAIVYEAGASSGSSVVKANAELPEGMFAGYDNGGKSDLKYTEYDSGVGQKSSPAGIFTILAGLGAAAVCCRRK